MNETGEYLKRRAHVLYGAIKHSLKWPISYFLTTERENPNADNPERDIMIYCIHGTADQAGSFSNIINSLELPDQIKGIKSVGFSRRFQGCGIEDFAKELKNKIVLDKAKNVIVMGHSRGGLVAAYFAELLAEANGVVVHSVITICSPFKGSGLAIPILARFSSSVQQMTNGSPYLRLLRHCVTTENTVAPITHNYLHFGASMDEIVEGDHFHPYEDADGRENVILLDADGKGHGHLSIMGSDELVQRIQLHCNDVVEEYQAKLNNNNALGL